MITIRIKLPGNKQNKSSNNNIDNVTVMEMKIRKLMERFNINGNGTAVILGGMLTSITFKLLSKG